MTLVESIVRHERRFLIAALIAIPLLCAAWIVPMARDMYGSMSGPSAWMMTRTWDWPHVTLLAAMWTVMMIGMMLPSVAPLLLIYASILRQSPEGPRAALRVYPMAGGYLVVWIGFSLLATFAQRGLGETVLTPMMTVRSSVVAVVLLVTAAAYQITPVKEMCLNSCRSPMSFIMRRMRLDAAGAFRMGVEHGVYCLGCCWALMLLLFAGGIMNLWTIAALMVVVLVEKIEPFGLRTRKVNAVGLLVAAVWVILSTSGCGTSSKPGPDQYAQFGLNAKTSRPKDRAYPQIVSVSPDTVGVTNGRIDGEDHFDLTYSVENASRLTKLQLEVWVHGIGRLKRVDVDLPADDERHQYSFFLEAKRVDVGPAVKFRVTCPSGDTDWMSLGHDREVREKPDGKPVQLLNIGPDHTNPWSGQPGEAVLVTLFGRGFDKDCTPEGRFNDEPLTVTGYLQDRAFHAQIAYRSLDFRTVGSRYLELKLIAYSTGYPVENTTHVAFTE